MERRRRNSRQPHLRVSMVDVAAEVGVSIQTVSRALRDAPDVSAETRADVLAAAQRLGYRRNRIASSLASGTTQLIGVLSCDVDLHGPGIELRSIIESAQKVGYPVIVQSTGDDSIEERKQALDRLISQGAGGVIIVGPQNLSPRIVDDVPADYPILTLGRRLGTRPWVGDDTDEILPQLLDHLVGLGHRHVGLVTGPKNDSAATGRRNQIQDILTDRGLPEPSLVEGDWSAASGADAVEPMLAGGDVTAVIAANDQMAIGFMGAAQARGVSIPADLSVAGLDDYPESAWVYPALTTIAIDHHDLGRTALEVIYRQITEPGYRPSMVTLSRTSRLIIRASTGPVRSARSSASGGLREPG